MDNNLGNKETMARNIRYYMDVNRVTAADMCRILGVSQTAFSFWINAKTYPRIDKIEMMANYFGISKADLVEERDSSAIKSLAEETAQHNQIIEVFDSLPPELRTHALDLLKGLARLSQAPDDP